MRVFNIYYLKVIIIGIVLILLNGCTSLRPKYKDAPVKGRNEVVSFIILTMLKE